MMTQLTIHSAKEINRITTKKIRQVLALACFQQQSYQSILELRVQTVGRKIG